MIEESFNEGVSPVIGVILLVAITVIIAAVLGVAVFDLSDSLQETNTGETSVDVTEGEDYLQVQPVSSNYDNPIKVLADGQVIKTIPAGSLEAGKVNYSDVGNDETTITVRSGGQVLHQVTVNPTDDQYYEDPPETLDSNDFELVSVQSYYSSTDERLVGTDETWKVKFNNNYDPNDFTYSWSKDRGWSSAWDANINANGREATFSYTSTSGLDSNAPQVTISLDGDSTTLTGNYYHVSKAIQSVSFTSDTYADSDERVAGTDETWKVSSITLHEKVDAVLSDPPESLSDYEYNNWRQDKGWNSAWGANINANGREATFSYTSTSGLDNDAPQVTISIPEISDSQSFTPTYYHVGNPISSVELKSQDYTGTEDRTNGTDETWEVTNVTNHQNLEKYLGSNTPESVSDYEYSNWRQDKGWSDQWSADINTGTTDYTATFSYTDPGKSDSVVVTVTVSEIGYSQNFQTEYYKVVSG